jgi:superfamily II DNA or RNA helicase
VLPTGGGKTITAATILAAAVAKGRRVGFAAHRKELIDQTVRTFARLGITDVGVVRAKDRRFNPTAPVQIASVQTLQRRDPIPDVDIWVIDEAHRAAAESYAKALFMAYPKAIFLGLTATPCRADGKPLGHVWDAMVIGARYSELIAGGHIVEPIVFSTPTQADLSSCRTTGGDYNLEDLEAAVNRGALIGNLVAEWQRHASDRRTVVFAVSVAHSMAVRDAFVAAGVACEHLDGTTPEDERAAILARLESGETRIVCNVGVLCEGWDMPSVKCCVLARPTKSLALYMQMSGRPLRPHESTPLILDHGGNYDRHGPPHEDREWSLDAKPKRANVAAPMKLCKSCFAYISAAAKSCPHCGAECSTFVDQGMREEDPVDVALAKRTQHEKIQATKLPLWAVDLDGDARLVNTFRSLLRKQIALNYKPGWIRHLFQAATKTQLPPAWAKRIGA